jgi:hypothetical protein
MLLLFFKFDAVVVMVLDKSLLRFDSMIDVCA